MTVNPPLRPQPSNAPCADSVAAAACPVNSSNVSRPLALSSRALPVSVKAGPTTRAKVGSPPITSVAVADRVSARSFNLPSTTPSARASRHAAAGSRACKEKSGPAVTDQRRERLWRSAASVPSRLARPAAVSSVSGRSVTPPSGFSRMAAVSDGRAPTSRANAGSSSPSGAAWAVTLTARPSAVALTLASAVNGVVAPTWVVMAPVQSSSVPRPFSASDSGGNPGKDSARAMTPPAGSAPFTASSSR